MQACPFTPFVALLHSSAGFPGARSMFGYNFGGLAEQASPDDSRRRSRRQVLSRLTTGLVLAPLLPVASSAARQPTQSGEEMSQHSSNKRLIARFLQDMASGDTRQVLADCCHADCRWEIEILSADDDRSRRSLLPIFRRTQCLFARGAKSLLFTDSRSPDRGISTATRDDRDWSGKSGCYCTG